MRRASARGSSWTRSSIPREATGPMMTTRCPWLAALVLAFGAMAVTACGDDETDTAADKAKTAASNAVTTAAAGTTMKKIQDKGEIAIGVKYDVPPFGFKDTSSKIQGFDVDLGQAVADALGVKAKFIEAISDNRIPFLKDGTANLILSTMTINTERDQENDFSTPYFVAHGRILVPGDNEDIKGIEDLAGKNVCTVLGSTYEETLKTRAPKATLRLVDTYSECLELIQNGAVDAVSTDDVILTGMIRQDDTLKLVGEDLTHEPYASGITD